MNRAMSRVSDAIIRFLMRRQLLQRFEKEVAKGEKAEIDVLLKKGTDYVVKGCALKDRGTPMLSLADVTTGLPVPTHCNGKGNWFYVTPERDTRCHIEVAVKPAAEDRESTTVVVTVSRVRPAPKYIRSEIEALQSCDRGIFPIDRGERSWLKDKQAEELPEMSATGTEEGNQARTVPQRGRKPENRNPQENGVARNSTLIISAKRR